MRHPAIDSRAFFIPSRSAVRGERTLLRQAISAIQLVQTEEGHTRLGLLSQLPMGTLVQWCGKGFDDRTVKVITESGCYFVFAEDLEQQES